MDGKLEDDFFAKVESKLMLVSRCDGKSITSTYIFLRMSIGRSTTLKTTGDGANRRLISSTSTQATYFRRKTVFPVYPFGMLHIRNIWTRCGIRVQDHNVDYRNPNPRHS